MPFYRRRLITNFFIFLLILVGGAAGYVVIEGWSAFDGLYMTIISVTTVGYQEVRPLSPAGKTFTMVLILFGVGFMLYFLSSLAALIIEGTINDVFGRKKLERQIREVRDHYIICGYGRIGRTVAHLLKEKPMEVVVIEKDPQHISLFKEKRLLYLIGEATSEEFLIEAGIERAKGLVAAASSDADNVYITLTARGLNPGLFILARAAEESSIKKLIRAGADKVVSPYDIGARRMAYTILRPTVIDFLELAVHNQHLDLQMEELVVGENGEIKNITLLESAIRKDYNLIIVAIKKKSGEMVFNPVSQTRIHPGDTLVALGDRENLNRLEKKLGSGIFSFDDRNPL